MSVIDPARCIEKVMLCVRSNIYHISNEDVYNLDGLETDTLSGSSGEDAVGRHEVS